MAMAARRILNAHHPNNIAPSSSSRPAPPARSRPVDSSFPMLLPVFILFVLLLCFLSIFVLRDLLRFFSLWLRRRRLRLHDVASSSSSTQPRKPPGLDPAILASFPTSRFDDDAVSAATASTAAECAVCLSEFAAGDAVRLLTVCRHAFHTPCIDSWLAAHTTCPVCRSDLGEQEPAAGEECGRGAGRVDERQTAAGINR